MSFGGSSRDHNINKQYTTLWLTGGYECTNNPRNLHVDLRVRGGVYIGKSLCVEGNICGKKILTDVIYEKHPGHGIDIVGDLYIDPSYSLFANNATITSLYTDSLQEQFPGAGISVGSNINMSPDTLLLADNIVATSIDSVFIKSNISETLLLEADQITSNIILANELLVEKELANLILANTVVSDTVCVNQKLYVDTIASKTGNTLVIDADVIINGNTYTGNLNLSNIVTNTICVNQYILVDTIKPKTANTIYMDGNVFFNGDTNLTEASIDYTRTIVNIPVYNVSIYDQILAILYSATGITTLNLPSIATVPKKRKKYVIVDEGGKAGINGIKIVANVSDTILGSNMVQINGNYNSIQIYSNEINQWFYF